LTLPPRHVPRSIPPERPAGTDQQTTTDDPETSMHPELPRPIATHLQAINDLDADAAVAPFADDAYVNDVRREITGHDAIRAWIDKELVGDHVSLTVTEVVPHHGEYIVRAEYEGDFDRSNLPDPLVLTNYFRLQGDEIVSLVIVLNNPSPYNRSGAAR
jgi:hypothetical protein